MFKVAAQWQSNFEGTIRPIVHLTSSLQVQIAQTEPQNFTWECHYLSKVCEI
jgi:hypothetical protein